jgi:Reverse transcriptase (RNA-dependent DNA polymerase)
VFDVKFDGRRKARLVAGGNHTEPTKEDIYSGVVSIEAVRMGFILGELNQLTVCAADISNAFLYGSTKEKCYIKSGPEFGKENEYQTLVIDKGLYGLRSSSARFHEHLSTKLRNMGYTPSKADSDFWIKDVGTHYEYIARYVDDLLVFSKDPMAVMEIIKQDYLLKGVGVPEYYLGGNITELDPSWNIDNIRLGLSAETYATNIVTKFETMFGHAFTTYKTPMHEDYHPESDDSTFLDSGE